MGDDTDDSATPRSTKPRTPKSSASTSGVTVRFDRGTLVLEADREQIDGLGLPGCIWDSRIEAHRAPGWRYRDIVVALSDAGVDYADEARAYEELSLELQIEREPFPHQAEAEKAWGENGGRGIVVLPTGAGKTFVAQLAMLRAKRATLVMTPTLDLVQQWFSVLGTGFGIDVGLLGGGYHDPRAVTVSTYDSAYLHMERLGDRFGLLVFDECHHLPGPSYRVAAETSIAPLRLGLTATLEREDGGERHLEPIVGPVVYRQEIRELAGEYLADYETITIRVRLSDEERERYLDERERYRAFVRRHNLRLGSPQGFGLFLTLTSQSPEGRRAFLAYREQKRIAQGSAAKIRALERLLVRHRRDRVLVFTSDNETVYRIARRFLIPAITHQTKVKERREILERFNRGDYPFVVTSKVLNEGVDVPAANVGVVLSGSASVREHVQRLGRILRRAEGKHAILYELVAEDTSEEFTSDRRRNHSAYR